MKPQAVVKPHCPCVLRSVVVGTRRLIVAESLYHAVLHRDPPPHAPLTVTIKEAQRLSGLSRATIGRMIKAADVADVAA
jgi:hypothetical protein